MFRGLIPLLSDRCHVIAPDYVGFGLSDTPSVDEFEYTFDHLTEVVEQFLAQLGIGRFAMYVQDYGAPVGWRLYLRDPSRVTALISQNGNAYEEGFVRDFWAPLWRYAADHNAVDEHLLRRSLDVDKIRWQYTHGLADPSVVDPDSWIRDTLEVNRPGGPDIQLALYADYPTNRELYPALHDMFRERPVPALILWGKHDEIFASAGAEAFIADLPEARLKLLDGGHWLLESHLEEVAELIHDFLDETLFVDAAPKDG
jgi:pimeloyl-ACP methyl ester carboxylesterase